MGLMDAKEYDPRPKRRRIQRIAVAIVIVIVAAIFWRLFRYWPEEHVVDRFLREVEQKNYEAAYGLYIADPNWKQHPSQRQDPSFNQFSLNWGPSGDYGAITSHHVECATEPPTLGFRPPSGVIVVVRINHRPQTESLWVEKGPKTITFSMQKAVCQ